MLLILHCLCSVKTSQTLYDHRCFIHRRRHAHKAIFCTKLEYGSVTGTTLRQWSHLPSRVPGAHLCSKHAHFDSCLYIYCHAMLCRSNAMKAYLTQSWCHIAPRNDQTLVQYIGMMSDRKNVFFLIHYLFVEKGRGKVPLLRSRIAVKNGAT